MPISYFKRKIFERNVGITPFKTRLSEIPYRLPDTIRSRMSEVNETQLRVSYMRRTLYKMLVTLLNSSIKSHPNCITKTNTNIGMAEIIKTNFSRFKNKKYFHKFHHKSIFYDTVTGTLKKEIVLNGIDLEIIYHLLNTSYLSVINNNNKCCPGCVHPCTVCTTGACENKADCKFAECSTCRSNDCLYVTFQCFTYMVYALRNVHSHCEHEFFAAFEAGKIIIFSNIRHSTNQYKLFQKKEIVKDINFWSWSSEFSVNFAMTLRKP